jgi:hypothetical protein
MKSWESINGILRGFPFALVLLTGFGGSAAGMSPVENLAIKGYDTVAYFNDNKALKGGESFTFQGLRMVYEWDVGSYGA